MLIGKELLLLNPPILSIQVSNCLNLLMLGNKILKKKKKNVTENLRRKKRGDEKERKKEKRTR